MHPLQKMLIQILKKEFETRKNRNPAYSLRAFSKFLHLSPTILSELLRGKRFLSKTNLLRTLKILRMEESTIEEFSKRYHLINPKAKKASETQTLNSDVFEAISEWYHFALLCLMETEDFKPNIKWMSQRLHISQKKCKEAWERLLRLNMIEETSAGIFALTSPSFSSPDEIPSAAIRKNHLQSLEIAKEKIKEIPLDLRDFIAVNCAIDPRLLPQAKKMLRGYKDELMRFLESGHKKEVYRFNLQLFPLT